MVKATIAKGHFNGSLLFVFLFIISLFAFGCGKRPPSDERIKDELRSIDIDKVPITGYHVESKAVDDDLARVKIRYQHFKGVKEGYVYESYIVMDFRWDGLDKSWVRTGSRYEYYNKQTPIYNYPIVGKQKKYKTEVDFIVKYFETYHNKHDVEDVLALIDPDQRNPAVDYYVRIDVEKFLGSKAKFDKDEYNIYLIDHSDSLAHFNFVWKEDPELCIKVEITAKEGRWYLSSFPPASITWDYSWPNKVESDFPKFVEIFGDGKDFSPPERSEDVLIGKPLTQPPPGLAPK